MTIFCRCYKRFDLNDFFHFSAGHTGSPTEYECKFFRTYLMYFLDGEQKPCSLIFEHRGDPRLYYTVGISCDWFGQCYDVAVYIFNVHGQFEVDRFLFATNRMFTIDIIIRLSIWCLFKIYIYIYFILYV